MAILTLTSLKSAAKKYGADFSIDKCGRWTNCHISAPNGHIWEASLTHDFLVSWMTHDKDHKQESILDALDRMNQGYCPCEDVECEECEKVIY
jgi:hypothetical protein